MLLIGDRRSFSFKKIALGVLTGKYATVWQADCTGLQIPNFFNRGDIVFIAYEIRAMNKPVLKRASRITNKCNAGIREIVTQTAARMAVSLNDATNTAVVKLDVVAVLKYVSNMKRLKSYIFAGKFNSVFFSYSALSLRISSTALVASKHQRHAGLRQGALTVFFAGDRLRRHSGQNASVIGL